MWLFLVLFLPVVQGSSALKAKSPAVSGSVKGSLTVQCLYEPGWETYKKWWCRGAEWSKCQILVTTNGSEQEVKDKRVSIQDNQTMHTFTITMEDLGLKDQDTYWCGIEKSGTDLGDKVNVSIDPVAVQCHYGPQWETYVKSWCQDADSNGCTIFVEIKSEKRSENKYVTINEKEHTFSMFVRGK